MNKTRVDDMLIEMIKPKLEEIEKKFTSGGNLTQDDINTLLLKSQYNHINHLDRKLDETVDSVKRLETEFKLLKHELTSDVKHSEERLFNNMNNLKEDMNNLKTDVYIKMDSIKKELHYENKLLRAEFEKLKEEINVTIQTALNKNMMMLIVVIGFFLTLSKIIDHIFK